MVKIHKLKQPNKHSGYPLAAGKTTEVKGIVITNKNNFTVHVDKFSRKPWASKKKKAVKKSATVTKKSSAKADL